MSRLDAWRHAAAKRRQTGRKGSAALHAALRGIAAAEGPNRRLLEAVRSAPGYGLPWTESDPLVTVTVPSIGREELWQRSLPSILGQTHANLDVVVAGDGCGPEVEQAVTELGDERVSYVHAGPRQTVFDDPVKLWHTAATRARNVANGRGRGAWILEFDDDDAMRPRCVEVLLALAREQRAEAAYGRAERTQGRPRVIGAFPPREGNFSWAAGIYHAGLGFFGREHLASDLGVPGDWWLAERMLRAGVRFAMTDEVVCDLYPGGPGRA